MYDLCHLRFSSWDEKSPTNCCFLCMFTDQANKHDRGKYNFILLVSILFYSYD